MKLNISNGNSKLGQIANTSFPPVITCRKGVPCATDGCYALRFYKRFKSCRTSWDENLAYYNEDPTGYWCDLYDAVKLERYFRYFVSGDIPDEAYFVKMIALAKACPGTEFLCFTKQYEIVNDVYAKVITETYTFPENLHILFSSWKGFTPENPHNFPTTEVITEDTIVPDSWKICGGSCVECVCRGIGCWEVKSGETIAFYKH